MNLDDLRRELRHRAVEPGPTSIDDRLAGVRSKVVAARRRKVAAGGAAALASMAVIGVTWSQFVVDRETGDDVAGTAFVPLPDQLNGDLLIEARYNESGASDLQWKDATLDNRDVVATMTCQIPEDAQLPKPDLPVQLSWSIGGQSEQSSSCAGTGDAAHSAFATTRSDWRGLGVRPHEPFEIELALVQGSEQVEVPEARFGIGLYEKTGERETEHGVELTELLDIDGERYRLADYKIRLLSGGRRVQLRTSEVDGQIAVVHGWHAEQPAARYELRQDGDDLRSSYGGSVDGPTLIDGTSPHVLSLQARGSSEDGVLVLAYYVLDD